jgi:hypothetical protein
VLDQVSNVEIGGYRSSVNDRVHVVVFEVDLPGRQRALIAVRVVKINRARGERGNQNAGVCMPSAITARR